MPRSYLDAAIEPAGHVYVDEVDVKNKQNRQRLEKLSTQLLRRAIWTMENVTQADCEHFIARCALWKRERGWVGQFISTNVCEDDWELVRIRKEPGILDPYDAMPYPFVPSEPDSENDKWPDEKKAVWKFVTKNVTDVNRHLVELLDPLDLERELRAKLASAKRRGL